MAEDKKYAQISNESIQTWAETVGTTDLSSEILQTLGADVTYRLQQTLSICSTYLSHCNRKKLTADDFNKALKLLHVPPVYGYSGGESVEWIGVPELGIQVSHDPPVNLASTSLSGDIFHQSGNTYVKGRWSHVSGHVLLKSEATSADEKCVSRVPLSPQLTHYYRTLFSVITNPSEKLFQTMCEDLSASPNIGPLVGAIIRGVMTSAQKASQKPLVLRRLLLVIRAILSNTFVHLGPQNYIPDVVNVLVFSVVTERKTALATHAIRSLAANILLKLACEDGGGFGGLAWESAVTSLACVVGSSMRPWTQHAGALRGLIPLGAAALLRVLMPTASEYCARLRHALHHSPAASVSSAVMAKDKADANVTFGLLLASFVNMMVWLVRQLPDSHTIYVGPGDCGVDSRPRVKDTEEKRRLAALGDLVQRLNEVYYLGEEMFGSAFVLQVPLLYLHRTKLDARQQCEDASRLAHREPARKRPKWRQTKAPLERRPAPLSQWFEDRGLVRAVTRSRLSICQRHWPAWPADRLRRKQTHWAAWNAVAAHPGRQLLARFYRNRPTGRMPHWTFIRPMQAPTPPAYSLKHIL